MSEQYMLEFEQEARDQMAPMAEMLASAGWPGDRIDRRAVPGGFSKAVIADVIAYTAREEKARVVVVGRTRHGRLHEALLKSMGERLTHYLPGTTVWVVGTPDEADSGEDTDDAAG
jgi:nucleotide-binding universal stress UspA family protein